MSIGHGLSDRYTHGLYFIQSTLADLYGDQAPSNFGTKVSYEDGGPDPLGRISVYHRSSPVPHWHFVTYGLTDLFEKKNTDPDISGWGFELTFRLQINPLTDNPDEVPYWALHVLQNLARYVFETGNIFQAGEYMPAHGPLKSGSNTLLRSMAFVQDPELAPIRTPNGMVRFTQVVGITENEEHALKQWYAHKALNLFSEYLPLMITDLARPSLLDDPEIRTRIADGIRTDGSSHGHLFVDQPVWSGEMTDLVLTMDALCAQALLDALPHRWPFGRVFILIGNRAKVYFEPGDENGCRIEDGHLHVEMSPPAQAEFLSLLKAQEGLYRAHEYPGFAVQVRKAHLTNSNGEVTKTVG